MPSQENNLWNSTVKTVGFEIIPGHSNYPMSGHPQGYSFNFERGRVLQEFQLLYVTKGGGLFSSVQIPNTAIEEGTMVLLRPGEWHTYRPNDATGWECYWVGFSGAVTGSLVNENTIISIGYDEEMVALYRKMLEVSNGERPGYQQLLSGILVHLLAYLFYREKDRTWRDKEVLSKIEKARLIIREKINSPFSPEEIAVSLNMSYTWFRRIFRQYTGMAPAQYISQLRIQKAKEMLSVTTMPVKEIALELGYESIDYFSTQFKKQTGQTPTQFRAMGQGNLKG
jgi:AraC-like DNA-binding protein